MFSLKTVKKVEKQLKINPLVLPPKDLKKGMLVENEHRNITHGNSLLTAKIALAHIQETPDYYKRLDRMEKKANKYWKNKNKPNIFL